MHTALHPHCPCKATAARGAAGAIAAAAIQTSVHCRVLVGEAVSCNQDRHSAATGVGNAVLYTTDEIAKGLLCSCSNQYCVKHNPKLPISMAITHLHAR